MKFLTSSLTIFLSMLFLKPAPINAQPNPETIKIQTSRSNIKPWLNFNDGATVSAFNTAVHGQALYISPDLNIKPGYISDWKWIKSEKKYRFTIDTKKKYHNGKSVSARDFEYVLLKPFMSRLPTTNSMIPLSSIRGIQKIVKGQTFKPGMSEGIKVIDESTIDVYIDSGHTRFLYSLGALLPPLAPIEEFQDDHYTFKNSAIGCGPYKVSHVDPKTNMVRVERIEGNKGPRFIEYYSDKTAFENKVDVAMGGGVYHMRKYTEEHPNEYRKIQGVLPSSIQILTLNHQTEAVQNPIFREAIAHAFDRNQPFPDFPQQSPTNSILPKISYGHADRSFKFDVEKAKKLFASLPKQIREKEYLLVAHGTPGTEPARYYLTVRDSLIAIGMKVKLELKENSLITEGDKSTTMALFGRFIDSNPLMTFAYYLPGSSSETLAAHKEYSKLFENAENSESIEEKAKIFGLLSDIIDRENIVIPYHQRYPVYFAKISSIKSLGLDGSAWTLDVTRIELNQHAK